MKWVCGLCGYEHEGDTPPEVCPLCQIKGKIFKKVEEKSADNEDK